MRPLQFSLFIAFYYKNSQAFKEDILNLSLHGIVTNTAQYTFEKNW